MHRVIHKKVTDISDLSTGKGANQELDTKVNHNCKFRANCNVITSAERLNNYSLVAGRSGGAVAPSGDQTTTGARRPPGAPQSSRRHGEGIEGGSARLRAVWRPLSGIEARRPRARERSLRFPQPLSLRLGRRCGSPARKMTTGMRWSARRISNAAVFSS